MEARCTVRFGDQVSHGKAYLGTDVLQFRGTFGLFIHLQTISGAHADQGTLVVTFPDGKAAFELGRQAERWARAIREPRGLLEKLGVKPKGRVGVVDVEDAKFVADLKKHTGDASAGRRRKDLDLVFLGAKRPSDLAKLPRLRATIKSNGAIWVVAPRGSRVVSEADVLAAGKASGLVDVKVVRFSETQTAHKFVIPVTERSN